MCHHSEGGRCAWKAGDLKQWDTSQARGVPVTSPSLTHGGKLHIRCRAQRERGLSFTSSLVSNACAQLGQLSVCQSGPESFKHTPIHACGPRMRFHLGDSTTSTSELSPLTCVHGHRPVDLSHSAGSQLPRKADGFRVPGRLGCHPELRGGRGLYG